MQMYDLMKQLNMPVHNDVIPSLIDAATRSNQFAIADSIFNDTLANDNAEVTMVTWLAKLSNLTRQGNITAAVDILDNVVKLGLKPLPEMYTRILGEYVNQKQTASAYKMWERMHSDGIDIERAAYVHMLKHCTLKREAERAFFYIDEMKSQGIQPDLGTFKHLFMAVATAPHFVAGYEDIICDAMAVMEGLELVPNTAVYVSVIHAFAEAHDPVAAEYYFWEMKRKGLPLTVDVYESLLSAYVKAQSVGAASYGALGRYSKPPPLPLSPDSQAWKDLGPAKMAEMCKFNLFFKTH